MCIQMGTTVDDDSRMRFANDQFYLKSEDEMRRIFANIPEACDNTAKICLLYTSADNPELLNIAAREDKELKVLTFLGEKFVNGNRGAKPQFDVPVFPRIKQDSVDALSGTKQILDEKGPAGVVDWVKNQKKLLITDRCV